MSIPKTTKAWSVEGTDGFESLKLNEDQPIANLGDHEVLVKIHYVSLNYRDVLIPKGQYPFKLKIGVIPGSDAAGEVIAVGSKVTRFEIGSRVVTLFLQGHIGGVMNKTTSSTGLGGYIDGVLRQYGAFDEQGLVAMPSSLTFQEAASLSCAGVTAWNALFGLVSLKPGDFVLTQGTGGVSIFALQFAKAAGATVIATTSSDAKAEGLKRLGADHVINYKKNPNWGAHAKSLTRDGEGIHHIIEVGGPATMAESLEAVRIEGVISIVGFLGGQTAEKEPSYLQALVHSCVIRGVQIGSRPMHEAMNRAIDGSKIKPVVDEKVFAFEELKEAYQYLWDQKHFGKLTIKVA